MSWCWKGKWPGFQSPKKYDDLTKWKEQNKAKSNKDLTGRYICDTINGNESLVEKFQFLVSYATCSYFKMLHFDAKQTSFKCHIWLQSYDKFVNAKNNIKQKEFEHCFLPISHEQYPVIPLNLLDHITYYW